MQTLCGPLILTAPSLHAGGVVGAKGPHPLPLFFGSLDERIIFSHRQGPDYTHLALALQSSQGKNPVVQAVLEEFGKPSSFPPMQGQKLTDFAFLSLGLLLLFWLGNYVVPDLIFRKFFNPDTGKKDQDGVGDKERILDGLVGGRDKSDSNLMAISKSVGSSLEEGTSRSTGFGKASKRGSKDRKGKD